VTSDPSTSRTNGSPQKYGKTSSRKTKYFDGYLLSRCVRFVKQRSVLKKLIALKSYTHFKALVILVEVPHHHQEMLKDKVSGKTLQSQASDHLPKIEHILPIPALCQN
jgi:hypothetical protein